jgi:hypothetical protein
MFTLFETPAWFAGYDLLLDAIAFFITLIISSYSFKLFRLNSERKFGYFSLAFALMSIAFLFKFITYAVVYSSASQVVAALTIESVTGIGGVNISLRNLLYRFGFFVQMAATLGSLLLLFLISQTSRDRLNKFYEVSQIGLFSYFVLLLSIVSTFRYTVFYLTSLVLLSLIVLNYYKNYLTKGTANSLRVLIAFVCLMIAQFFFVFVFWINSFYFIAEVFTLIGFAIIAFVYMQVNRQGKRRKLGATPQPLEVRA